MSWRQQAACRGSNVDTFVSGDKRVDWSAALSVCEGCAVRDPCLSFALDRGERLGVWGGMTPQQRDRLLLRTG